MSFRGRAVFTKLQTPLVRCPKTLQNTSLKGHVHWVSSNRNTGHVQVQLHPRLDSSSIRRNMAHTECRLWPKLRGLQATLLQALSCPKLPNDYINPPYLIIFLINLPRLRILQSLGDWYYFLGIRGW